MIKSFSKFFGKREPRQECGLALARLLSQLDLQQMPFDNGIKESRRKNETRYVAVGVWLMPLIQDQEPADANFDNAIPAVTCDIRRLGFGILAPLQLPVSRVLLAVADPEGLWRFFVCAVRHNSPRPGGWFQMGLSAESMWEAEPLQMSHFRSRVETAFASK